MRKWANDMKLKVEEKEDNIYRGPFELIFDDKTDNPFSLQISTEQFQTMISVESYEKEWII